MDCLHAVLVAYELSTTELKIQRIVRVWEGLASALSNLTNKSKPQASWEIASKAPAPSKMEIILRNNSSSFPKLLFCPGAMCLTTFRNSQELCFPWQTHCRQAPRRSNPKLDGSRIKLCCQGTLILRWLLRNPRSDHWLYIDILLREEDYAQATHGCGRSKSQIVCSNVKFILMPN